MSATKQLIEKIQAAIKFEDLVDILKWRDDYKKIMMQIHPDICTLPGAVDAATKLNQLKEFFEKGGSFSDESGIFRTNGYKVIFEGDYRLIKNSFDNYKKLYSIGSPHFIKYLPEGMEIENDLLTVSFSHRSIPLTELGLPQEHVNWILSRLLEFVALMEKHGFVHCGLNPESVFIVPETHGIQVVSFYHMAPLGKKVSTINAKFKDWYPPFLYKEKIARSCVDLELAKKTAIYLLGDRSGSGIKLKKTHNSAFIDYIIRQDFDPAEAYDRYRKLLRNNFEQKFHILNL